MFCPRCGFIMADNSIRCPECGFIVSGENKDRVKEKQPVQQKKANDYLKKSSKIFVLVQIAGVIVSLMIALSYTLPWMSVDYISLTSAELYPGDILAEDWIDSSMDTLKYIPTIVPILGIISAFFFALRIRGWGTALGSIFGFTAFILSVAFGFLLPRTDLLGQITYSPDIGSYIPIVLGLVAFSLGIYQRRSTY